MRILRLAVYVVVVCLGVAACAPNPGGLAPAMEGVDAGPFSTATPTPDSIVAKMAVLDAGLISGASVSRFSFGEVHSDVVQVPDLPGLALGQEGLRNRILQHIAWSGKKAADLKWRVNSAGLEVAVLNVEVSSGDENSFATLVYDALTDQTYNSNALIEPVHWKDFVSAVGSAEGGADLAESLGEQPYPYGRGPALGFTTDGGLVVRGETEVELAPAQVAALLSPLGRSALVGATTPTKTQAPAHISPSRPGGTGTEIADSGRPGVSLRPDCQQQKCIALTFDDGPVPETAGLVELLRAKKVPATFFTLGKVVQSYPEVVKQIAATGNQVGWHTATHRDLVKLPEDAVRTEISSGASVLAPIIGGAPLLFRPPYGSHSTGTDAIAGSNHMASIFWNIDTRDWDRSKVQGDALTQAVVLSAVAGARPGAIILLHDIHETSRAAVGPIIDQLRAKGYTFVTVGDLPGAQALTWGKNFCLGQASEGACN